MTKTLKKIKKLLAVAVTAALLALPLGTTLALADTNAPVEVTTAASPETTSSDNTGTDTAGTDTASSTDTTSIDTANPDTTNTANEDADNENTVVDADGNKVDPGTWLSDLIVKLKLALSFDPVRKSELSEQLALAKLAKAHKLMTEGKTEKCQLAFNEYSNKITKAQEFLEKVEDAESEKAQKLTVALTNVNQNNIEVLGNLLDKLPPQAAQKLAVNVVRSMEKAVTKLEKQEAKLAEATVPETTTPVSDSKTTPADEKKVLKKQAREALKEFKNSLNQKGKIHLDGDDKKDRDQDRDRDKKNDAVVKQNPAMTIGQPTSVTVAPAKVQSELKKTQTYEQEKKAWNQKNEKSGDRYKDKKQDNKWDSKYDHR
ncbi:DUF5667 domain-containing protein [Desulfosporosinus youngiae]|uniref:DUF5667 domain-containing protein n=1 Tax=Desulfosporosinus youngiae DSM 17734 TaxID=768710 RepID=H5Y008_9FIRM|nr:DUF5667 domain-containing protein [Desulfosporosinus youngiae]EHQ91917.1 hypothetical protein DesyoDRAFT_4978 [Desulfosporosinus youngiae DSM 17734]